MELFGSFEIGRVLDSGGGAIVYEARKTGDAKGRYAVKVFAPERLGSEPDQAEVPPEVQSLLKELGDSFITRADLQRKAGESSRYFVPVLAAAHDSRGAWYAAPFYARSVKGMLERFIALEGPDLFHILDSVLRAALELKRTCGRSHGNLKPSNVFLDGLSRPRRSRIVVADPLAGGPAEAEGFERADLRAIGELLYQLVMKRKVEFGWVIVPLEASPEWTRVFGKCSAQWLELCNRLLDPNLSLERTSLEILEKELRRLRPRPPVPLVPVGVGAGVVLLAALGAFWALHKRTTGNLLVRADPAGSQVVLIPIDSDGNEDLSHTVTNTTGTDGRWKGSIEKGAYKLRLEYRSPLGNLEASRRIPLTITAGGTVRTNLSLFYGGLVVVSEPPGAEFTLNDRTWHTPFTNRYALPEQVELQLRLEGYETTNFSVTIPSNHAVVEFVARLRKPPPGSSLVEFTSDPPGAELFLDGVNLGKAPRRVAVEVGSHQVGAELLPWFARQTRQLEVAKGAGQNESFYFPHGLLVVSNTTPRTVQVYLNDRLLGVAPTNVSLPPGDYALALEAEGYETNRQRVTMAAKGVQPVSGVLKALAGFVELTSDPPGATVLDVSNHVLAVTSLAGPTRIPLPPGTYALHLTYGDLVPLSREKIDVKAGRVTALGQVSFDYGSVEFMVQPPEVRTNANIQASGRQKIEPGQRVYQRPGEPQLYEISAPGYQSDSTNITLASRQNRIVSFTLARQTVPVTLVSEPPGVSFFADGGNELKPTGQHFLLTWGTHQLVARHPRLGAKTNTVTISLAGPNSVAPFTFSYGTLILTNLPKDIAVLDGSQTVGAPGEKVVYEPLGAHTYTLRGRFRSETVTTNIVAGLNFLQSTAPKSITSSVGLEVVQARLLSDPKGEVYVGKFEVTQAEYSKVMKTNPSIPQGNDLPVNNVSPQNAIDFCRRLSDLDKALSEFPRGYAYRLLTVSEWQTLANDSDPALAVFSPDASHRLSVPSPVGSKGADADGICDLLGNVWEMCLDPARGDYRMRGGSYNDTQAGFRFVLQDAVSQASPRIGFRVVLAPSG